MHIEYSRIDLGNEKIEPPEFAERSTARVMS